MRHFPSRTFLILGLTTVVLLVIIETSAYFLRSIIGRDSVGWIYTGEPLELSDPCLLMRSHPFYSHTHSHNNNCHIKEGYAEGPFVHYDDEYINKKVLIALGGSTTDGFYQHVSEGETWPLQLNRMLNNTNVRVINGGTGGYDSSKELLKLLVDVGNLPYEIDYVVSLNGINDIAGYGFSGFSNSDEMREQLPFFSLRAIETFDRQVLVRQDKSNFFSRFFPATNSVLLSVLNRSTGTPKVEIDEKAKNAIFLKEVKKFSAEERWLHNISLMHAISNQLGAEYHVFLQPTMGIKGIQSQAPDGSNDHMLLNQLLSREQGEPLNGYLERLNSFYDGARKLCQNLVYCHDISDMVPPTGDVYSDPRHHNQRGNLEISRLIYEYLNIN